MPSYARYTDESEGRKVDEGLAAAAGLFEEVIAWLQDHYSEFEFWVERDLVWTVQSHLGQVGVRDLTAATALAEDATSPACAYGHLEALPAVPCTCFARLAGRRHTSRRPRRAVLTDTSATGVYFRGPVHAPHYQ